MASSGGSSAGAESTAPRPRASTPGTPGLRPGLRWLQATALLAGLVLVACLAGRLHGLMIEDDAFIFVRYANNLLQHGSISWNPGGPPTYGTTSLLYLVPVSGVQAVWGASPARVAVLSSLLCGLAFLVLAVSRVRRATGAASPGRRTLFVLFLLLPVAWSAESFGAHFVTGMDTMFALLAAAVLILAAIAFEERSSRGRGVVLCAAAGTAFFARPDLALYAGSLVLALGLWPLRGASRGRAAWIVVASLIVMGIGLACAWAYFGHPLPLSYFVKSAVRYGGDLEAEYAAVPGHQLGLYAASYGLWLVPIGARLVRDARQRRWSFSPVETALLAGTAVFVLYYRFFVLQVMPHYQRFYYPTLPALVYLAARSAVEWANHPWSARWRRFGGLGAPGRTAAIVRGAVCLALLAPAIPPVRSAVTRIRTQPFFYGQNAMDNHKGSGHRYWFRLEEFAALPVDLVLATTEIGLPGVLFRGNKVVDLSGLNDPRFARHGFDADVFFGTDRPDLVYMPAADYRIMTQRILEHPSFRAEYEYYPNQAVRTSLGIALRRTSVHYSAMRDIVFARAARQPRRP